MSFKFAISAAGDLLGFLFLEIPTKFKNMKKFKLEDWFSIKQISVQENNSVL